MGEDLGAANLPAAGYSTLTATSSLASCAEVVKPSVDAPLTYKSIIVVSPTQVFNGINEELVWFENFKSNIEFISATKAGNLTYTLGINEFADLTQGVVSLVKIQRQCGSSWGFSTTGALEGAWALSTGSPASLNTRQFVDCDSTCSG